MGQAACDTTTYTYIHTLYVSYITRMYVCSWLFMRDDVEIHPYISIYLNACNNNVCMCTSKYIFSSCIYKIHKKKGKKKKNNVHVKTKQKNRD